MGGDPGTWASSPQAVAQGDPAVQDGTGVNRCEENRCRAISRYPAAQQAVAGSSAPVIRSCPLALQPQGHRPKAASKPATS